MQNSTKLIDHSQSGWSISYLFLSFLHYPNLDKPEPFGCTSTGSVSLPNRTSKPNFCDEFYELTHS